MFLATWSAVDTLDTDRRPYEAKPCLLPAEESSRIVGASAEVQAIRDLVARFAATDASVLITGESGTGKELVARALHEQSARAGKPFVAVNCAAFPEALLEAELFGHERGAFTGAVKKRDGRFRIAHTGTLLLDEVGEIPIAAQAKLLRVLQEGTFEPLGTNETVEVDVRIISATHRDLKELVAASQFREDLYYRLKILELKVPPLRERRGDLALMVDHFLRLYSPGNILSVSKQAMSALAAHPFHGNVRELDHAILHAIALCRGGTIELEHLPTDIAGRVGSPDFVEPAAPAAARPLSEALQEFERSYLAQVLAATSGHRSRAAKLLGISRKNLWERLRRLGLDPAPSERKS